MKIGAVVMMLCVLVTLEVGLHATLAMSAEPEPWPCGPVEGIRYDPDVLLLTNRLWQPNKKKAEKWIRDRITDPGQVHAGEAQDGVLDLLVPYPGRQYDSDRVVSAKFLEDLLTGVTPHAALSHGIQLAHAHLVGARFRHGLNLSDTVFTQPVDASNLTVDGPFTALRTRFMDPGEKSAIFQRLSVAGPLSMRYASQAQS